MATTTATGVENETSNGTNNASSWSVPFTPGSFSIMREPLYFCIVVILYTIVIVFGALGNILVVVTIAKTRQLWNATNIFIANLALADILVCVFDLPLNAYYQLTDDWVFGKALCHVIPSAFAVVVYASTLSLTMIAIDRFILIVFPLKTRMSINVALSLAVVICLVSVAVASPIGIYAEYHEVNINIPDVTIHWRYCGEKWPNDKHRRLYTILTLALQYFIPLIVIAILYSCIFQKVRERLTKTRGGKNCRKTKTTKMLVAVVTIFAITWTPFQVFSLMTEFSPELVRGTYYKFADSMLRVLAMSSSCINPVLYGWLNDNYRSAFLSIVRRPTATSTRVRGEDSEVTRHQTKTTSVQQSGTSHGQRRKYEANGHDRGDDGSLEPDTVPLRPINNNGLCPGDQRDTPPARDCSRLIA